MRWLLRLFIAVLVCSTSVSAEVVDDLYGATVPVRDQGSSALALASQLGLAAVLVKVSGSEDILRNPQIAPAVSAARSQVQQYSYLAASDERGGLQVRVEFDADFVTGMVIRAGEPLWTANRPAVLAWVVVEDAGGERFVSPGSDPELVRMLREAFAERGVPLQLPLYDLADTSALRPPDVQQFLTPLLLAASERYGLAHVVGARLTQQAEGESIGGWIGDWSYFYQQRRSDRYIEAATPEAFLREGAAVVAQEMASRYAVLPSRSAPGTVVLSVTGVSSYVDYAEIVSWLEKLELVHGVRVRGLTGDRLQLGLDGQADAVQLATLIELNRNLIAAAPAAPGQPLEYRWQR
ncbi:MAG: hypothetical protein ACI9NT_001196 [Bacteroidia bacterium]|jgi:hypothetical protein